MTKYWNYDVVFSEIPDEVTLAINITNCPNHCKGCHSAFLADDIGEELIPSVLDSVIKKCGGITCVAFMGGDAAPEEIDDLANHVKETTLLCTAWYSGKEELSDKINLNNFDYIKLGPYMEEFGPLNKKTTNQRLYKIVNSELINITYKFWKDSL